MNRIRRFDGYEEYMVERENRDLGAKFMDYLRSQDTPVVVELKVDVFCMPRIVVNKDTGGTYLEYWWTNEEAAALYLQLQEYRNE